MSDRHIIQAFMAKLIEKAGGFDAAAAIISARLGHDISKGSISKRQSLQLDWPFVEIMALEDAVGDRCISDWRQRTNPAAVEAGELMDLIASAGQESGEAISELVRYAHGTGDRAKALKELEDSIAVKKRLRALLEGAA